MRLIKCIYSGESGTKGPITTASGGVSKIEDNDIVFVSPIKKTDELETLITLTIPTFKSLLTTV
jgi:hypothetical protein